MVDPYSGILEENPYDRGVKTPVRGTINVVLAVRFDERNLELIQPLSRAVLAGEIHEIMVTDEDDPLGRETIDSVGVIGFMQIQDAGVIAVGDYLQIDGDRIGTVVGFDASHMPNHYNVVLAGESAASGMDRGVALGEEVLIDRGDDA